MLKSENYCISAGNILSHEIIGLETVVKNSSDRSRIGLKGKIVDETKNTLCIETENGEKVLPKKEVVLEIFFGDEKIELDCKKIAFRPEDRVKKLAGGR